MKSVDLIIRPRDPVILRDGRPFGQSGTPQTGSLRWPRPGTIMGMTRTYIGRLRDAEYFEKVGPHHDPVKEVKRLTLEWFLAATQTVDTLHPCIPAPSDAVLFPDASKPEAFVVQTLIPCGLEAGQGTDIPWPNWLYPWLTEESKPAKNAPMFWKWGHFSEWLVSSRFQKPMIGQNLGLAAPDVEERTHVCIDPSTGTAAESRLFTTMGLRFPQDVVLTAKIKVEDDDAPPRYDVAALGGDRRAVFVEWGEDLMQWPSPPQGLGSGLGLRLFLITPGLFAGGWAPSNLKSALADGSFVDIAATGVRGRLRSASVPRWQPHHGWDMTIGKGGAPKSLRKLAPAGTVYFVELEPGTDGSRAAKALWNASLCSNEQHQRDGFGRILVGNWEMDPK